MSLQQTLFPTAVMLKGFRAIANKTLDRLKRKLKCKSSKSTTCADIGGDSISPSTHAAEESRVAYEVLKTLLRGVNESAVMSPHLKMATAALLSVLGTIDVCDLSL